MQICTTQTASAAFLLCLAAGVARAENVPVTEAIFKETHVGHCIVYTGDSDGRQCYAADGTSSYDDKTYGEDTGEWKIKGNEICVKWSKEGKWICEAWTRTGDNAYSDGGEYTWHVE